MHRHAFFRTARTTQAALTCGADIEHLADLDRTYWAILSRPEFIYGRNEPLTGYLDTNEDGRIRMPEVLAAIEWLKPRIASFDRLFLPYEGLVKEDFRDDTPEGKALSDLLAQIAPDGKPVTDKAIREYHTKFYFIDVDRDGDASIEVEALDSKLKPYAELVWKVVGPANQTLAEEHLPLFYDLFKQWRQWQADKPKGRFTLEDASRSRTSSPAGRCARRSTTTSGFATSGPMMPPRPCSTTPPSPSRTRRFPSPGTRRDSL